MAHDHEFCEDHDHDHEGEGGEVPEGAAVLPFIPENLNIHPLLLAVVHCVVFFDSSTEEVLNEEAGTESLNYIGTYLQRLRGAELRRIREDLDVLVEYAKSQEWPGEVVAFFQNFLQDFGVTGEEESGRTNLA